MGIRLPLFLRDCVVLTFLGNNWNLYITESLILTSKNRMLYMKSKFYNAIMKIFTEWKVSVFGVVLVSIFPALYGVSFRIQSECGKNAGKMQTRVTSNTSTFYAVFRLSLLQSAFLSRISTTSIRFVYCPWFGLVMTVSP